MCSKKARLDDDDDDLSERRRLFLERNRSVLLTYLLTVCHVGRQTVYEADSMSECYMQYESVSVFTRPIASAYPSDVNVIPMSTS